MTNTTEVKAVFQKLIPQLRQVIKAAERMENEVSYKNLSPDERLEYDQLRKVSELLSDSLYPIEYLTYPIQLEGILYKKSNGRYEMEGLEFTSGSPIEVLIHDDIDDFKKWVRTRVEHNGGDYYLVGHKSVSMTGLHARIRGRK